ncbi:MAG: hypothetical protein A2233_05020 [Candidatus Kerfeldbacteria bacterium RIFOXYA2_FULL_38_24]|uniref:GRAM domain-containing protein n=1 Tax=Candidatus Kerfeldbacteria bacterium RIFOXYB2_FULL_38_14 TaxID=1798547 RepID=A0A1G2BBV9_9BACT|nr:MAG: hypothetical protein A2233_05020 [Candidatus Kerfeldbacteria bacterium RIFOXYA2_FULL_38_24]OGY85687.1 MAG: hypothetical protein A2319_05290 [Candidatus Kerfeldbacteria bacterium RIFOXYB2_FULL_38_14]OGY88373.1 MAG: hypothetical protein A2458_02825 [Candidatus Kerfeldbacteria bacterium RIFOXYC2_FULL_38_9]
MNIVLQPQEHIIRQGYANHFEHHVRMTGKLYLTNQRLYFVTHALNFKQYHLSIPLQNIIGLELKNNLKFFSHGLLILLKNEQKQQFIVWLRKIWKRLLEQEIKKLPPVIFPKSPR